MNEIECYNFGKNLRRIRKEKGYTQEDLAKVVDLNRSAFSSFENNKRKPTYTTLVKLADFLEVEIKDLLGSETNDATSFMTKQEYADHLDFSDDLKIKIQEACDHLNDVGLLGAWATIQGFLNTEYYRNDTNGFKKDKQQAKRQGRRT